MEFTVETIDISELDQKLRVIKLNENTYFNVSDIGNILKLSNPRQSIQTIPYNERHKFKLSTPGGEQTCSFLTLKGLKTYLTRCRCTNINILAKYLNVDIINLHSVSYEISSISCIMKAFKDEKMTLQYYIDKYRIDLFFNDFNIAVECDENQHKHAKDYDQKREEYIIAKIGCTFIRYHPDKPNFDIFEVINNIYSIIKIKLSSNILKKKIIFKKSPSELAVPESSNVLEKKVIFKKSPSISESSSSDESESTPEPESSTLKVPKYGRTNTIQRKVQQYDPTTFKLIKTYEGLMDVIRCNPKYSKFGIKKAAEDDMIYCSYRWFFIEPDAEIKEYKIPPTVKSQASSIPRYIAFLNKEKTKIEKIYPTQRGAAKDLKMRIQTINDGVKSGKLIKQTFYVCFYDDLSDELKNEYLSHSSLPKEAKNKNSTGVQQINQETKEVIKTYESIADVLKEFYMSRASLKRAMENNVAHQGYLWRSI